MSEPRTSASGSNEPVVASLASLLLSEETVSDLLEIVVNIAVSAVAGVDGASVSLLTSGQARFETSNASSELIRRIDEAQYAAEEGPCVQAIRDGQECTFAWPSDQWPMFATRAAEAGVATVWSLPLIVRDQTLGALNLYTMAGEIGTGPDGAALGVARNLAAQAAVVLANAATLLSARLANDHLKVALETRDTIGQAKGVLMARQAIAADEAFDVLRRASQRTGHKLREVAAEVVAGLDLPSDRLC